MTAVLRELHVVSLGIVDDLTVLLGPGLTAITGETGAGKTLLVEAIDLLLGARPDVSLVRSGDPEARIEGRFERENGEDVVLVRVVPTDGRTRAYVDGRLVTVTELAAIGAQLVDVHGQHLHHSLLQSGAQRDALDAWVGPAAREARSQLQASREEVRRLTRELEGLGGDERARAREVDLLQFQIAEIEAAAIPRADEDAVLELEEEILADATAHREAAGRAFVVLDGPALDGLGTAVTELGARVPFTELTARLRLVQSELADLGRELRLTLDGLTEDPARLDAVRSRRQLLRELTRKYGDTLEEVLEFAARTRERLDALTRVDERAADLEVAILAAQRRSAEAADTLSQLRHQAAVPLAAAITGHLRELAMPNARLVVDVTDAAVTDDGADEVTFLLAANAGEPERPLAKAASGGELSRAMLALRLVLSDAPPTLVFDEVDAGIGGQAGVAVGRLLKSLASTRQVLCVTHLAQIAAFADEQLVVEKLDQAGRTVARATSAEGDTRVEELSRMLAGVGESEHARSHAAELLERGARRT